MLIFILFMTMIVNPYLNFVKIDERKYNELYMNYNFLYIICNKTDTIIESSIYNYYIEQDILTNVKNKLILYKVPIQILKNINNLNKLMVLSSEKLENINIFNYELKEKNLVLLILNIKLENLQLYISQFEQKNDLINLYKTLFLNSYFNTDNNNINNLLNLDDSNYWCNSHNCNINFNYCFEKRIFNINKNNIDEMYLNDIKFKINNHIDLSNTLSNIKYKIFTDTTFTCKEINNLFDLLNEKQRYILFCNLLVSKKYCHFALNNKELLLTMKNIINKFIHIFRYLIGYTWLKFYFDESIKKTFITKEDNFIFELNTACELPLFPFLLNNPKLNPYMPILVNNSLLNPSNNIGGICDVYKNKNLINGGLCNLNDFKIRLNIFATGNSNNNLFENINWTENKMAISGSIMVACLQKKHPLTNLFQDITDFDQKMNRFYNEYYTNADIDIMILTQDIFEYIDIIQRLYDQITINICSFYTNAEPSHVKLVCDKIGYLFISEHDVLEQICENSQTKLKEIKQTIETTETIELFKNIINTEFNKYKQNIKENDHEKYADYYNFENIKIKIKMFKDNKNKQTNFNVTYKYKINSQHINHNLEIFMVNYNDFFATVHKFHLPCVRGYYNGDNVYLTPSCISAHLTYMNIDYKYFAGSSDPVEIVNKYRLRGFGTWFNKNEKWLYINYTSKNTFWNNFYDINIKNNMTINNTFGDLYFNSTIFQPRLINETYFINSPPVYLNYNMPKNYDKMITRSEFFDEINYRFNTNSDIISFIHNLQTINNDGSIKPLEKWTIEAVYNIISTIKK